MDDLTLISKLQKSLKTSVENISNAMIGGGVDNME